MFRLKPFYLLACFFIIPSVELLAQVQANFGEKAFGNCEVLDAAISHESIAVKVTEYNMDLADWDNLPKALGILISVEWEKGFNFPIEPEDPLTVQLSSMQFGQAEMKHFQKQIGQVNQAKIGQEQKALNQSKKSIEAQVQAIQQQLMAGKISPEAAATQIEKLTSGMIAQVEASTAYNVAFTEMEDRPKFSIWFYDTKTLEESNLYSGTLRIHKFDGNEFVADFEGMFITECMEKRAVNDEGCAGKASQFLPDLQVLREEKVKGSLRFKIARFEDNR